MGRRLDTRAIGLDIGLQLTRWLTGAENLHYGLWTGLDVIAANVGAAQAAYTDKLFELLPEGPLRILDIGGGAGETARKLIELGHIVDIVVPSAYLAERCRENAPEATIHQMMFEDFESDQTFDLCLFSESFQYIPMAVSLPKAVAMAPAGHVIISDNFRTPEGQVQIGNRRNVGSGHEVGAFDAMLTKNTNLTELSREDITRAVAPSVEVEQDFFLVFGHAFNRIDEELRAKKPRLRGLFTVAVRIFTTRRQRDRLRQRLTERTRTAEAFVKFNRYLMVKLAVKS